MIYNLNKLIKTIYFKLLSDDNKMKVIINQVILFRGLNKLSIKYSDDGDLVTSSEISSDAIQHFYNAIYYCKLHNVDHKEIFKTIKWK